MMFFKNSYSYLLKIYKDFSEIFRFFHKNHNKEKQSDWEASDNWEDNQEEDNLEEDNREEDDQAVKLCLFKREPKGT